VERGTCLLVASSSDFRDSADVVPYLFDMDRVPHAVTNKGLQFEQEVLDVTHWPAVEEVCPPQISAELRQGTL
jgi:hypothetical protein